MLRTIDFQKTISTAEIARLNRFQYNNTVRDVLDLKIDVFALPEKLMTRHDSYLSGNVTAVPDSVRVESLALRPRPGLKNVNPFPKDSRANHGFDNQADKLTISPLLLDAFLRLSVSIVESPDFNPDNVGVWEELLSENTKQDNLEDEVRQRLRLFLPRAFRRPVDTKTLDRYTSYAVGHMTRGLNLTDSMKKVVSAILSSPKFFYRTWSVETEERQFEVASKLSYTLWGSCPDDMLLGLAAQGQLSDEKVLRQTIARMMQDPKIERFLDSFPVQWMQLETLMAVTPDPAINRYFSLDRNYPATVQMALEPLLLFDAIYVENRSLREFISPAFSYRSPFLKNWYENQLAPPPVNEIAINTENEVRIKAMAVKQAVVDEIVEELEKVELSMVDPVGNELVDVDLAAGQAAWEQTQMEHIEGEVILSAWYRIGPFGTTSLDQAQKTSFVDESAVDLDKQYGELKWELAEGLTDAKIHMLTGVNSSTYLYRTLKTDTARSLEVSLGTDDSFKLWLNGVLVGQQNVVRGVAPDQNKIRLELAAGENKLLFKVSNGGCGYAFYFKANPIPLPPPVVAALNVVGTERNKEQQELLTTYYLAIAPELKEVRKELQIEKDELTRLMQAARETLDRLPKPKSVTVHRAEAQREYDQQIRNQLRSQMFTRVPITDPRFGGIVTNAAMLSMTSGPQRTHPVARGVWVIEVIFNDPPSPPPNDIPPLNENSGPQNLTVRERFAAHRENVSCAGCHSKLDPLGFALENYDITGRWRDEYANGRDVDATGTLMRTHEFSDVVEFKESLVNENDRFARAFISHLFRFSVARELGPHDSIVIDEIVARTKADNYPLRTIIEEVLFQILH
ncbi:MAG: DUF1588 domain-containing protein [Planctomycetota bacterium]|nr:DUF1588 domain-containing protein [Planctomycetota bacterium]